jgi:hypothetical protein
VVVRIFMVDLQSKVESACSGGDEPHHQGQMRVQRDSDGGRRVPFAWMACAFASSVDLAGGSTVLRNTYGRARQIVVSSLCLHVACIRIGRLFAVARSRRRITVPGAR